MRLTGANLSLTLPFASLLTAGFVFPVRPTTAHSLVSKKGKIILNDGDGGSGFAAFDMFITYLNKRTFSYHTNNAGLHMSRSALVWGRFEHLSEIRE